MLKLCLDFGFHTGGIEAEFGAHFFLRSLWNKEAGRPMFSTGTGLRWAISTSFTLLPAPPIMAFSSTVTSASWLAPR